MDEHDLPQPTSSGAGERDAFRGNVLALKPLLRRLRDGKTRLSLCSISLAGPLSAKLSAYANDITVFVSHRLDIIAPKKVVARYEQTVKAKINFDKSEGLQLGTWKGGVSLPGPFLME